MPLPRPILVTGAAGFIGSHAVRRLLARGDAVVGLDSFCEVGDPAARRGRLADVTAGAGDRFTLIEADIRDAPAVDGALAAHRPAGVIHLAAMAGVRPSIADPAVYAAVNVMGTTHVLSAAVAHGVERFIFASSSSVYGNNTKVPFHEDDRVDHPISPYAATKKAGELLCHTFHHLHALPVTCLRFFTVFGPRQRPDLAIHKFLRSVADGRAIPVFGDGTTRRDYTYIDDIVTGVVASLDRASLSGPGGGYRIYNLGNATPVTLSELIATVGRVVGREPIIDRQPMQPGDVEQTYADITRAREELDYAPTTTIEAGIAAQWKAMQ